MSESQTNGQRLAKYLSWAGIASRRNCEQFIIDGRVTVNGIAVTTPAFNVIPGKDVILFDGKEVNSLSRERVYILLNKPAGYTCSAKDVHADKLVYELLPDRFGRLFTVGRLDRDSEGMIILTNDGDYAQQLTHPSRRVIKRYYVECDGQFTTSLRRQMMEGMYDNGEYLRALHVDAKSVQRGRCALVVTLGDGRKREVRRLCKDVGLTVTLLRRIAIGCLELDSSLAIGAWRLMSSAELESATRSPKLPESSIRPDSPEEALPYWQKRRQAAQQEENGGERRPFKRERDFEGGERPERGSFRSGGAAPRGAMGGRPARSFDDKGGEERRPFKRDFEGGERRPFKRDFDGGERRPFKRDFEGGEERRPFKRDFEGGERRPFKRDFEGGEERRPFKRNFDGGERRPFKRDFEGGERRPFKRDFDGGEERRPFKRDFEGGERRPFKRDFEGGERRPFKRDFDGGERRPFKRDFEGGENYTPRKWYESDGDSDFGGKREERSGDKGDMRFTRGHKYPRNWR